ncbi:MAG: ATP-binding cassette domain-containing protein [Phycisphaeraceae bacterium]|nr:ATP-binding cassette domain-containing protein [Phycisphaeraceae bacterium]
MAQPGPTRRITGAQQSVVVCQGLVKTFKDFWMRDRARAVDGVTFEIRRGEVFGLLGPNGSGKSTTIKIILGLLRPTKGRVAVFGQPPSDVETKKRIGYLPEESFLYAFLNARETLEYYAKLFEIDRRTRQKRIDELLDMVGLRGAQFRQVREYSKGMQRRIGIAQALINDPDLLILDEPTSGLDPLGTRQVKDLIIELGRRGKTILLSSHLLADVEDCVHRMVILYGGKIRAEGTCEQLLESPSRTTIETEALDDDTIAEIDRIIRERSHGSQSVLGVSRPRQKLEELFLDIVARAKAEAAPTSGASSDGRTAAFLMGKPGEGADLISSLTSDAEDFTDVEPMREAAKDERASEEGAREEVISALMQASRPREDAEPGPQPEPASPEPPATSEREAPAPLPPIDRGEPAPESPRRQPATPTSEDDVNEDLIRNLLGNTDDSGPGAGRERDA